MTEYTTEFGSLSSYRKGGVHVIDDDPRNYVFSNVFEVASKSAPFERICVAKNHEYVVEAARAEGASPWFVAPHDEFVLCLDGEIVVELVKPTDDLSADAADGASRLEEEPAGARMGRITAGRGHMALLPAGAAYRLSAAQPSVVIFQSIDGPVTVHKWAEICQTD